MCRLNSLLFLPCDVYSSSDLKIHPKKKIASQSSGPLSPLRRVSAKIPQTKKTSKKKSISVCDYLRNFRKNRFSLDSSCRNRLKLISQKLAQKHYCKFFGNCQKTELVLIFQIQIIEYSPLLTIPS